MVGLGRRRIGYAGVSCPRCKWPLRHEILRSGRQVCSSCNGVFEAIRFDPVEPGVLVPELAGMAAGGSAPCARHARNQAESACARCGQFMCSLCKIDADGKVYCPSCFERLSAEGTLTSGVTRLWNWRGLAAACLLATWLLWFTLIIPAVSWIAGISFCVMGLKEKKARNETDGVVGLYVLIVVNILAGLGVLVGAAALFGAFKR